MIFSIDRLANLLHLNNLSEAEYWNVVKKTKFDTSIDTTCDYYGFYNDRIKMTQVEKVKQQLQLINSSEVVFINMTTKHLKAAAELFIYLNACPANSEKAWFRTWFSFFTDLFQSQSADQIIQTLNRIIKMMSLTNKDVKIMEKLLERATKLLSLKYPKIQSMLQEKEEFTSRGKTDAKKLNSSYGKSPNGMKVCILLFYCLCYQVYIPF